MAIADADGNFKRLRSVAETLIAKAESGDVQAIKEIADRLDGKVAQAIIGDDEADPVTIRQIITGVPRATDN